MSTAITVRDVSKRYRIGLAEERSETFAGQIMDMVKAPLRNLKQLRSLSRFKEEDESVFWALRDINFDVQQGEVLGIIGRNGAGKSTLLKILARITEPTTGEITIKGRVSSILEVGSGFHSDLTGLDNIYMNGTILGMKKKEIDHKLEEIISFSGVSKYINTPVKRYSSGMKVRLAFAVAAHLEPDILIIDEVLAVGDAEFQKKCLGKMEDVATEGKTVLFVSHNMAAVKSMCHKGLVLEKGRISMLEEVDNAVSYYIGGEFKVINSKLFGQDYNNPLFKLNEVFLVNKDSLKNKPLVESLPIHLHTNLVLKSEQPQRYHVTYHLSNEMGEPMFSFSSASGKFSLKHGENKLACIFPAYFLQSGQYFLSLLIVEDARQVVFVERDIISFIVADGGRELGVYMGREPGYIRPQFEWKNLVRV